MTPHSDPINPTASDLGHVAHARPNYLRHPFDLCRLVRSVNPVRPFFMPKVDPLTTRGHSNLGSATGFLIAIANSGTEYDIAIDRGENRAQRSRPISLVSFLLSPSLRIVVMARDLFLGGGSK
ncbi:hypothetical protein GW17_00004789, partial [Ensete ventricosum]